MSTLLVLSQFPTLVRAKTTVKRDNEWHTSTFRTYIFQLSLHFEIVSLLIPLVEVEFSRLAKIHLLFRRHC